MKDVMNAISSQSQSGSEPADRRGDSRLPMQALTCDSGLVQDLSEAGARLQTRRSWKEGRSRPFTLRGSAGEVTLTARCVWVVKDGLFKHTVGVHFENVSDEQRERIKALAATFNTHSLADGYQNAA